MSSGMVKKVPFGLGDLFISDFQTFTLRHADGAQPPEESKRNGSSKGNKPTNTSETARLTRCGWERSSVLVELREGEHSSPQG